MEQNMNVDVNKSTKVAQFKSFEDVTLSWNGEEKTVLADDVFEMVCRIENALSGGNSTPLFMRLMQQGYSTPQLSKGYAEALRCAGHIVSAQDVYLHIESGVAGEDLGRIQLTHIMTTELLAIVAPNIYERVYGEFVLEAEKTPE